MNNNNSTDERMSETHVREMQLNKMRVVELKDICTVYKISHYRTKIADLIVRIMEWENQEEMNVEVDSADVDNS